MDSVVDFERDFQLDFRVKTPTPLPSSLVSGNVSGVSAVVNGNWKDDTESDPTFVADSSGFCFVCNEGCYRMGDDGHQMTTFNGGCETTRCPGSADHHEATSDNVPLLFERSSSDSAASAGADDKKSIVAHCHYKRPSRISATAKARKQLIVAGVLCLVFIGCEVTGGYFSHSLAIMSDAAHMLSDFATFCVSLFSIWIGGKPARKAFNYGYLRAEAIGALFTIVIIWFVTCILVYLACGRISDPDGFDVDPDPMMVVAGCAVVFNIVLGILLHGVPHGHSHGGGGGGGGGHSHLADDVENHHQQEDRHINIRAAMIHVLGDLIQSIGVLLSSVVIKVWPSAKLADPLCTLAFSVIVMCTTVTVLRDTVRILMEGFPTGQNYQQIYQSLSAIENVIKVHDLKVWSLTYDSVALTAHLAVNPERKTDKERILQSAMSMLRSEFKIHSSTIQIEDYKAQLMNDCDDCNATLQ